MGFHLRLRMGVLNSCFEKPGWNTGNREKTLSNTNIYRIKQVDAL